MSFYNEFTKRKKPYKRLYFNPKTGLHLVSHQWPSKEAAPYGCVNVRSDRFDLDTPKGRDDARAYLLKIDSLPIAKCRFEEPWYWLARYGDNVKVLESTSPAAIREHAISTDCERLWGPYSSEWWARDRFEKGIAPFYEHERGECLTLKGGLLHV